MVQLRVLHRDPSKYNPTTPGEVTQVFRNADPNLHPFERAREYQRALVAAKMERMFAKPLLANLEGHSDAVRCMQRSRGKIKDMFTGGCDGDIRQWDLARRHCVRAIRAHDGFCRGICVTEDDQYVFSIGDDKKIKQWLVPANLHIHDYDESEVEDRGHHIGLGETQDIQQTLEKEIKPLAVFVSKSPLTAIDHHYSEPLFVTTGERVEVWDPHRSTPLHSCQWGYSHFHCVRFNAADRSLFVAGAADNTTILFDLRSSSPVKKILLRNRTNGICWNPMEPVTFTIANEDSCLYSLDVRRLEKPRTTHKDFTNAVLDVDYAPTGKEFVATSFDRTLRIWQQHATRSREVYHTKRMQHVLCARYTNDARFIASGSSDMIVRVWKAEAAEALGPRPLRERSAIAYRKTLVQKYKHMPEINKIVRQRWMPKHVRSAKSQEKIVEESKERKELNVMLHSSGDRNEDLRHEKRHVRRVID